MKKRNKRIKELKETGVSGSIRIIDYTNDIISRDSINWEQKPLKSKTKTETENNYWFIWSYIKENKIIILRNSIKRQYYLY